MATVGVKWLTFTAELLSTAVHEKFATILCLSSNIPWGCASPESGTDWR